MEDDRAKETSTTPGGGIRLETELARIVQIAKERPEEQFTSLARLLDEQMLTKCLEELKTRRALVVDGLTWNSTMESVS